MVSRMHVEGEDWNWRKMKVQVVRCPVFGGAVARG